MQPSARPPSYTPTRLFKADDIPLTAVRDKRPAVGPIAATDDIYVADICEPARCPRRAHERCPAARDRKAATIGLDDAGRVAVCILFDCYLHEVHPISDHSSPYRRNYPTPAATRAFFITAPLHISECVGDSCLGGISATPLQSYTAIHQRELHAHPAWKPIAIDAALSLIHPLPHRAPTRFPAHFATGLRHYAATPLQSYTPTIKQASGKTEGCPKWHPVGWLLVIIFFARAI